VTPTRIGSLAFVLALATAGCPVTNTPGDDAAGADASPSTDTFPSPEDVTSSDAFRAADVGTDAFLCPDLDGDGDAAFACGGGDCADDDPTVSSLLGPCASPTSVRRCVDGGVAEVSCAGDTPYCDARTGECVIDACGDGVVHANEVCDGGSRCWECHTSCGDPEDCPEGLTCSELANAAGRAVPVCRARNDAGLVDGSECTTSDDCSSRFCGPEHRCTVNSLSCPAPQFSTFQVRRPGPMAAPYCQFECHHESECPDGAPCRTEEIALHFGGDPVFLANVCSPAYVRGSGPLGSICTDLAGAECASAHCVEGRCSLACRSDADCGPGAPRCVAHEYRMYWTPIPRGPEFDSPWPMNCIP
jgi:hypothetical protein